MGTIVVVSRLTLDGVVQGEASPDEDSRGGFEHGGWASRYDAGHGEDDVNQVFLEWERTVTALLFGRTTYKLFADSWGRFDEDTDDFQGEITRKYNRIPSTSRRAPLLSSAGRTPTFSARTCQLPSTT